MESPELVEAIQELAAVLENPPDAAELVMRYAGEPDPSALDFLYAPLVPAEAAKPESEKKPTVVAQPAAALTPNAACRLCTARMYPVRRFQREGKGRVLFLYFNGAVEPGKVRTDKSEKHILGSPEEDELLFRMLGAADFARDEVTFQEYPACHFSADRSSAEDWTERAAHCRTHVQAVIEKLGLKRIIATGPSAFFLLGKEKALAMAMSGISHPVQIGEKKIPVTVVRSPAALLAMEKKRRKMDREAPEYAEIVAEEKLVKDRILTSLKAARAAAAE